MDDDGEDENKGGGDGDDGDDGDVGDDGDNDGHDGGDGGGDDTWLPGGHPLICISWCQSVICQNLFSNTSSH